MGQHLKAAAEERRKLLLFSSLVQTELRETWGRGWGGWQEEVVGNTLNLSHLLKQKMQAAKRAGETKRVGMEKHVE